MAVILQTRRAIERLDAVAMVEAGEWAFVAAEYVWLVVGGVVLMDGVLRLDGVVRTCGDV